MMYGDRKTMDFSPSLLGRTFRAVTLASTLLASVAVPFHIQTAAAASLKTGRYEAPNGSVIEVQGKSFYYTGKWNGEPVRRKPFVLELRPDATFMMARTVCSISDQSISCTSPSGNQTTYAIQLKQPQVVQQNPVGESNKQPAVQDTTNQKSEARLADLEGRLKNAQSELEAATEAKKSALDENALLRKETEKTLSDKSLAITVANAEAESAQKQVQILSADVKEMQARELIVKSEAAALNERLVLVANEKAKEVEAAKLEATNAQTKLQAFTAEISELKSELQKKKSESSALLGVPTSVSAENLKEIEAIKIEAAKAQTQVIALTEELKELRDKAVRAASETAAARDTLTVAVADKQKEVSVARADLEKTQKQLSVLTAERAALQEQADKAVAEATNMRKALELTIAQKTKDLDDAAADVANTRKKIEALNAEMQEIQAREKQTVAEVTSLRGSLASATADKEKELASASAAVANADRKAQDLLAELNQLKAQSGPSVSELSALRSLSSALPPCPVEPRESKTDCLGIVTYGPGPNAGDYFLGEYRDGKRSGRGTYIFSDGRKYVGDWKDNKTEGFGILFNSDGSVRSKGIWSNNQFIRPAEAQHVPIVTSSPAQSSPSNSREAAVQQRRESPAAAVNEREIDILRQKNQTLADTAASLKQRLVDAEKRIEEKSQEEIKTQVATKQALENAFALHKRQADEIQAVNRQIEGVNNQLRDKQGEALSYGKKIDELSSEREVLKTNLDTSTAEAGRLSQRQNDEIQAMKRQITEISSELEKSRSENISVRKNLQQLEAEKSLLVNKSSPPDFLSLNLAVFLCLGFFCVFAVRKLFHSTKSPLSKKASFSNENTEGYRKHQLQYLRSYYERSKEALHSLALMDISSQLKNFASRLSIAQIPRPRLMKSRHLRRLVILSCALFGVGIALLKTSSTKTSEPSEKESVTIKKSIENKRFDEITIQDIKEMADYKHAPLLCIDKSEDFFDFIDIHSAPRNDNQKYINVLLVRFDKNETIVPHWTMWAKTDLVRDSEDVLKLKDNSMLHKIAFENLEMYSGDFFFDPKQWQMKVVWDLVDVNKEYNKRLMELLPRSFDLKYNDFSFLNQEYNTRLLSLLRNDFRDLPIKLHPINLAVSQPIDFGGTPSIELGRNTNELYVYNEKERPVAWKDRNYEKCNILTDQARLERLLGKAHQLRNAVYAALSIIKTEKQAADIAAAAKAKSERKF